MKTLRISGAIGITIFFALLGWLLYAGWLDAKNVYVNAVLFPGAIAATVFPGLHSDFAIISSLAYNVAIYFGLFVLITKAFKKSK